MQLASGSQIPDGLLAAITLLSEKPRHGVTSKNPAPNQGIDERNSTAAIGLRAGLLLNRVQSHFTGKERDTESGNDYFGARYYASSMGPFMSPDFDADDDDPEPVPYANLEDPQSLNLYSYVGNNPLNKTDENGHFRCNCQPDPDYWKHQQEEARRQWLMLQLMAYAAWKMEEQRLLHPFSNPFKPAASPSPAPAESTPADPNQNKDGKPKLVSNPKHNPNSSSPEPKNAQELYNKSIKDGKGRFWAKDDDGVIHRFAAESNGETHWNGSTAGSKPIRMEDIPNEIRNSLK